MKTVMRQLARLARDESGNALPIMVAGLLPILITIGCGIDYARMGLIRSEMQEAVDSAALAGRRNMTGDNIVTAKPQVDAFFDYNFDGQAYGVEDLKITVTKPEPGTVEVLADVKMRTTLMKLLGVDYVPIQTVGRATQNLDNIDIMLVLDTTGSMEDKINGQRKIDALRSAVKELYNQLAPAQKQLEVQGLRMRIGVLPYAATVNVGKLIKDKSPSYLQTTKVPYYQFYRNGNYWYFGLREHNLSNYISGGPLGNINGHTNNQNDKWDGCIEERQTLNNITANDSRTGPPPGANDLDIDLIPNGNDATKWKPYIYDPVNNDPNTYCPNSATALKTMTQYDLDQIVNKLEPRGSTYHDIGMIWGTRMISNGGIFGYDNPSKYKDRPVNRYIIYMTDGNMSAPVDYCARNGFFGCIATLDDHSLAYSAYGIEAYDRRVGATSTNDNNNRHTKRFQMACSAAKAKRISVWTIGFGTGSMSSLTSCASNSDQASTADNSQELIEKFSQIGKNIGALRLSK